MTFDFDSLIYFFKKKTKLLQHFRLDLADDFNRKSLPVDVRDAGREGGAAGAQILRQFHHRIQEIAHGPNGNHCGRKQRTGSEHIFITSGWCLTQPRDSNAASDGRAIRNGATSGKPTGSTGRLVRFRRVVPAVRSIRFRIVTGRPGHGR